MSSVVCEHYGMELSIRFRVFMWTVDQVVWGSKNGTLLGSLIQLGCEKEMRKKLLRRGTASCVRQSFPF